MILISHRGNTTGPDSQENSPDFILSAIDKGFDVEIDVWEMPNGIYLGHDSPKYLINLDFLSSKHLWCHAKNLSALNLMVKENIKCFWHQEDDYTLTSSGHIWTYPLKEVTKNSIIVCKSLEDTKKYANKNIYGICSDYVGELS